MSYDLMPNAVHCSAQKLVGLPVQIHTADALNECFHLWQDTFAPYIKRMTTLPTITVGVIPSYSSARETFKYIASIPSIPGMHIPEDLVELEIPAGLYLENLLIMQQDRDNVLQTILEKWLPAQKNLKLNISAPIYELYPVDFPQTGLFTLYVPVTRS